MSEPITVAVDPTNPGQFFACCGLLELADRLWPGAEGWFSEGGKEFHVDRGTLREVLDAARRIQLAGSDAAETEGDEEDDEDDTFSPMDIVSPFRVRLDWWQDKGLKPWAGSMNATNIAVAMFHGIDRDNPTPFDQCEIVPDPPTKKFGANGRERTVLGKPREPFYLDARRGANAVDRDVGFVPDSIKKAYKKFSFSYPVVEALALIGLQRSRPIPTDRIRTFEYCTWTKAWRTSVSTLPVMVSGLIGDPNSRRFRFRNSFRTGQEKHKTYMPATPIPNGDQQ